MCLCVCLISEEASDVLHPSYQAKNANFTVLLQLIALPPGGQNLLLQVAELDIKIVCYATQLSISTEYIFQKTH